jgi:hypothetical protein
MYSVAVVEEDVAAAAAEPGTC